MDAELKKDVWKVFNVTAFLFISIFFILPYIVQVSTYFHEKAHGKALDKHGLENYYELDLLRTIPNFFNPKVEKLGVTRFSFSQYQKLNKYQRAEINLAGIVSDLKFLFLIGFYLSLSTIYLFYKIRFKKEVSLGWVLAINWVLFMWLLTLIQITLANITYDAGDVYQLIKYLRI